MEAVYSFYLIGTGVLRTTDIQRGWHYVLLLYARSSGPIIAVLQFPPPPPGMPHPAVVDMRGV